jgi:hypothetical protein
MLVTCLHCVLVHSSFQKNETARWKKWPTSTVDSSTPRDLEGPYQHFGGTYHLHIQGAGGGDTYIKHWQRPTRPYDVTT